MVITFEGPNEQLDLMQDAIMELIDLCNERAERPAYDIFLLLVRVRAMRRCHPLDPLEIASLEEQLQRVGDRSEEQFEQRVSEATADSGERRTVRFLSNRRMRAAGPR